MKVLVVGGYGTFGGRTVELLEGEPRLILVVAGRSLAKADAYCNRRAPTAARLRPALFDRDGDLAAQLAAFEPDIVVDASGPFQAVRDLGLRDYEALFAGRTIYTGFRNEPADRDKSLYAVLLGDAWHGLPREIRAMHDCTTMAAGRARVERGRNVLGRLMARMVGFPGASEDIPVHVRFDTEKDGETWTRTFGKHSFSSLQFAGRGRSQRLLCERFGPLTFAMALVAEDGRLALVLRRWSFFGLPLPRWLGPRSTSYETAEDGRFRFHVEISHPLAGMIACYRGWLEPSGPHGSSEIVSPASLASSRQSCAVHSVQP